MQLLETADLTAYRRGACDRCGSTERMVDTDILVDYEGVVVLCGGCIGEAALIAGYLADRGRGAPAARGRGPRRVAPRPAPATPSSVLAGLQTTLTRMQNLKGAK
jgi:hypothetical protein